MAVSAEHRTYNNTLYNNLYYIQTCDGKTRTELSVSLHNTIRTEARKNLPEKTPIGKQKTRLEIGVGSMAHALKSPSYEGYTAGRSLPLFTNMCSNKARKALNNFSKRKQAKKPLRNSICH